MRAIWTLPILAATLSACAPQKARMDEAVMAGHAAIDREIVALTTRLDTQFQLAFYDTPFAEGAVSVVAAERGELRTYRLTPCREGTRICGSHTGQLTRDGTLTIVTGAYPGRTFYLAQGGDGVLTRHGSNVPLAWEFTRDKPLNAPPIWSAPTVE